MTTIVLPAKVAAIDELEASAAASQVTDSLRAAGTALSDVSTATAERGAPADWSGDAAEAAGHRMTRFADATDVVAVALETVTLACDTYVDRIVELTTRRDTLDAERTGLNQAIDDLTARIGSSTEADVPALRSDADRLADRAERLGERITGWYDDVTAAEDRLIAAFRSVDTAAEAQRGADDRGRVDVESLLDDLRRISDDPDAVNDWWKGLTPEEREALKIHSPEVVGNLNGIPSGDRDEANRSSLERDLDHLNGLEEQGQDLTDDQQRMLDRAEATQTALDLAATTTDPATGEPVDANLLLYLPEAFGGDGAGAVAYGDPDTADNTAVIVPGLTNDLSKLDSQGEDALRLFMEASASGESVSTIAWMGYNAPSWDPQDLLDYPGNAADVGGVGREDLAEAGGHLLSDFVDGLRATDEGDRSHLTVIGHSYGSTTAAHAAHDGLDADSLALIGSPGAGGGVDHVSGLNMPTGHVYVGAADNDFVTWLGRDGDLGMGHDPAQGDFGATVFPVDPGAGFHVDDLGQGIENHTSYFDDGSSSLHNLGAIVNGDEPSSTGGRDQSANDMAVEWAENEAQYQAQQAYDQYVDPVVDGVVETGVGIYDTGVEVAEGAVQAGQDVADGVHDAVTDPVGTFEDLWP